MRATTVALLVLGCLAVVIVLPSCGGGGGSGQACSIAVTSTPSGASITLDGVATGNTTPHTFSNLAAGNHTLQLALTDYQSAERTRNVAAGQTWNASFTLTGGGGGETSHVTFTSTPPGAQVDKRGSPTAAWQPVGTTPIERDWPAGTYLLRMTLSGYQTWTGQVTLVNGQPETVSATLQPAAPGTCTINVESSPGGAAITIDGQDTGETTPHVFTKPPGTYRVRVTRDGYYDAERTRELSADDTWEPLFWLYRGNGETSWVTFTSTPPGALVTVLSSTVTGFSPGAMASTPVEVNWPAGTYQLRMTVGGAVYDKWEGAVTLAGGQPAKVHATLPPLTGPGTLDVTSTPAGAAISINGQDTGQTTPHIFGNLTPGRYAVRLTLGGYKPWSQEFDLVAHQTWRISPVLQEETWIEQQADPARFVLHGPALFGLADDADQDNLSDTWESILIGTLNPVLELAEGEDFMARQRADGHAVYNFCRVAPYVFGGEQYVVIWFCVTWTMDYGRLSFESHWGDVERVVMALRVTEAPDERQGLEVRYVYMAAHESTTGRNNDHSWAYWPGDGYLRWMRSGDGPYRVHVQASEGKHAMYATEGLGESARLTELWWVLPDVYECCGGGPLMCVQCINVGEPNHQYFNLIDNAPAGPASPAGLFPGEYVWDLNRPFAGGGPVRWPDEYSDPDSGVDAANTGPMRGKIENVPPRLAVALNGGSVPWPWDYD